VTIESTELALAFKSFERRAAGTGRADIDSAMDINWP
jgi:hypothetical protein